MRKRFHIVEENGRKAISVSLKNVAEAAGVSLATASRVLNGNVSVAHDLKVRVEAAASELSYVPDAAGRALASKRTMRIACLLPTIDNAIFARFAEALQRRARDARYSLMVSVTEFDAEIEAREIHDLVASGVDGLVLVGAARRPEIYKFLANRRLPFVLTNIHAPGLPHVQVGYDNFEASRKVVNYLVDIGHRQIATIDGPMHENDRAADRRRGVRSALMERGLTLDPRAAVDRHFTIDDGRIAFRTIMENCPDTTAITCGNDILAIGAMLEAKTLGLRVPEDVSITGFDDLDLAAQLDVGLTTIRVPTGDMGHRAAETLLDMINDNPVAQITMVPTSLVLRGSTGVPRQTQHSLTG